MNISSALDQPGRAVFHFQSSFIMKMLFVSVSGLSQTIREFSKDSSCENCKIENGNICYYSLRPKVGNLFNMNYEFGTWKIWLPLFLVPVYSEYWEGREHFVGRLWSQIQFNIKILVFLWPLLLYSSVNRSSHVVRKGMHKITKFLHIMVLGISCKTIHHALQL